jgi:ABC-type transport system involved in cytochrome c biogenesis permease subunit
MPAIEWLAEVMFNPEVAESRPNFRIDNLELKQTLGLPIEPDDTKNVDGKHFSYAQLRPKLIELQKLEVQERAKLAREKEEAAHEAEMTGKPAREVSQNAYQSAMFQLQKQIQLFWRLENIAQPRVTDLIAAFRNAPTEQMAEFLKSAAELNPQDARDWKAEMNAFLNTASAGREAFFASREGRSYDAAVLNAFKRDLIRFEAMGTKGQPLLIPTNDPVKAPEDWHGTNDAMLSVAGGDLPHPALRSFAQMGDAFRGGRAGEFNEAVADYLSQLQPQFGAICAKAAREQAFNHVSPFTKTMAIYVVVGILAICFWFAPVSGEWLRRSAVMLCLLALVLHAGGLITRMVLEGRPPVTNLYSAAVFIGFAACVLGLVLEMVWRNSIGVIVSAVIGFCTLLIAQHLSLGGDTMEMLVAVLDTNFWLATHVVIVTLGYASTYVSGFLAIVFVLRGIFSTSLDAPLRQSLAKMIYAITCFAALFSFVGTVLGGIWADQSWGRFWGWDPKENGALIIVLWNVLILHARWGGMVRERGLAVLAIFGNIVTSWSFFGTNMLGVGLHSYGFMDQERVALIGFVFSQLALMALGSLPLSMWRSYRQNGDGGGKDEPSAPTDATPQAA